MGNVASAHSDQFNCTFCGKPQFVANFALCKEHLIEAVDKSFDLLDDVLYDTVIKLRGMMFLPNLPSATTDPFTDAIEKLSVIAISLIKTKKAYLNMFKDPNFVGISELPSDPTAVSTDVSNFLASMGLLVAENVEKFDTGKDNQNNN